MGDIAFRVDDLSGAATQALVKLHLAGMHRQQRAAAYKRCADIGAAADWRKPYIALYMRVNPLEAIG